MNGEKSVGFAPSTSENAFAVINGTYNSKESGKQYANIPVDYDWSRTTARWFFLTSKSYYEEMAETTVKSSTAYRNNLGEDDEVAPATETSGTKRKTKFKAGTDNQAKPNSATSEKKSLLIVQNRVTDQMQRRYKSCRRKSA